MGDLNLDYKKRSDVNYQRKDYFELFEEKLGDLNLLQLVNFDTWSRMVGATLRASMLDHIYVKNVNLVKNVENRSMCFGDHVLVLADVCIVKPTQKLSRKRDWRKYSKDELNNALGRVDWSNNAHYVQEMWNDFETKLINVVDTLVPVPDVINDDFNSKVCPFIKNKLNPRNRLLKVLKKRPSIDLKTRIKNLNIEIVTHFRSNKRNKIRNKIIPGSSKSLWNAVNSAHDTGTNSLPDCMKLGGVQVEGHERSEVFARFFENKVKEITDSTLVDQQVYNGRRKFAM